MILRLNRFTGNAVINLIRHTLYTRLSEIRPIAFKIGSGSNVLEIGDAVEEDMTEFINNVSNATYLTSGSQELITWQGYCSDVLKAGDIETELLHIRSGRNVEILHSFSKVPITVYFRNTHGKRSRDDNKKFLLSKSVDVSDLVIVNSRHCSIHYFESKLLETVEDTSTYEVTVMTKDGTSEDDIIKQVFSIILSDISKNT